jgi:hypothetical protein
MRGFNLGLVMRHLIGSGTPRGPQDRPAIVITTLSMLLGATRRWLVAISHGSNALVSVTHHHHRLLLTGDHLHHGFLGWAHS